MSKVNWGKPRIFVKDVDDANASWYELNTPVEDSTELTPTKGDKMEAKVEGGENEDVKYKRSTYELAYNIRMLKGRQAPFAIQDGIVDHHFGVLVQPEDAECEGFYFESSTVSVDQSYTAAEGSMWQVHHDAIKAAKGDTVKWGKITLTTTGEGAQAATKISFTEGSSQEKIVEGQPVDEGNINAASVDKSSNKGGKPSAS